MLHLWEPGETATCEKRRAEKDENEFALHLRVVYPPATEAALAARPAGNVTSGSSGGGYETSTADSGATSNMTPSAEGLHNYQPVSAGTSVETVDGKSRSGTGRGLLEIKAEQLEGPTGFPLGRALHVPTFRRNLISERQLALMTRQLFSKSPWRAHVGVGEDACCFFDFKEASGL